MALLCQTLLGLVQALHVAYMLVDERQDVDLPMQHSMPGLPQPASNLSDVFSVPGQPIKYLSHLKGSSCLVSMSMLCVAGGHVSRAYDIEQSFRGAPLCSMSVKISLQSFCL